ncbi:MAG: Hsp20/alpha crystallin family protein [Candidatus Heimdallarchaeota archaeon]|nr:Hsp20/alpha crystallin family protein [Candidatus Heimdallarchaeota archaeon]
MNSYDDDNNKKKNKKKKPEDDIDDDFEFPFDLSKISGGFSNIDEIMEKFLPYFKGSSFGKIMDELMKNLMKNIEEGMDSGSLEDMMNNPYVFGFNIGVGPDGKPSFGQFGNIKPKAYGDIEATDVREPLIDVFKEEDKVRVIAEVPGINKGDIKLSGSERTLTIKAHSQFRKYEKSVSLPVAVLINTAKAKYKNGVLEVIIEVKEDDDKKKDHKIDVE